MYRDAHLPRRISLRMQQLDMLLNLVETASVRATAEKMGLTQSAISKSLKELESTMGVGFFERTPVGLRPTAHCAPFERYARDVIHGFNLLCRELHACDAGSDESLNVGATAGGAHTLLMRFIQHPFGTPPARVTAQMEGSRLLVDRLVDGELDVVIAHVTPGDIRPQVRCMRAGHDDIVAVAHPAHPVFRDLRRYHHHPWMLPGPDEPIRKVIEQRVAETGHHLPRALVECATAPAEPEVAMRDEVVVWTTRALAGPWVARGDLRYLALPFTPPILNYYAMRLRTRRLPPGGFMIWGELLRELRTRRHRIRRQEQAVLEEF